MIIKETDEIYNVNKLVDELETYGFEKVDNEEDYDKVLPDGFYATANIKNMGGFFLWNPDGNGKIIGQIYNLNNIVARNRFFENVYNIEHGYTDIKNTVALYEQALLSIGFTKTNDGTYKRVEINEFNNGLEETITAEFDFKSWYGEVTKEYNDPDYGDEWHQYNSFADWGEDADIFS